MNGNGLLAPWSIYEASGKCRVWSVERKQQVVGGFWAIEVTQPSVCETVSLAAVAWAYGAGRGLGGCNAKARTTCARFCFQKIDLLSTFFSRGIASAADYYLGYFICVAVCTAPPSLCFSFFFSTLLFDVAQLVKCYRFFPSQPDRSQQIVYQVPCSLVPSVPLFRRPLWLGVRLLISQLIPCIRKLFCLWFFRGSKEISFPLVVPMSGGHADAIAKLSVTSYFRQSSFGDWFVRLRLTNGNGLVTTIFQVGNW